MRTEMLLGPEAMARLRESHVAVFGLGGVGSWCAEALARTGVGTLTLVDQDTVSESNCNRQLCATAATVGRPKAEVMAARLKEICPESSFLPVAARYAPDTRAQFFSPPPEWDYLADCIDLVSCKLDLIVSAREAGVPVVSALGTGNKLDAGLLELCDISRTKKLPPGPGGAPGAPAAVRHRASHGGLLPGSTPGAQRGRGPAAGAPERARFPGVGPRRRGPAYGPAYCIGACERMDLNLSAVRLVALDLDDTTLDNKSALAPETRTAIERCIHAGITVTLATGRSFSSLPEALLEIPGIPYAVTSNGATVCALPEGRCLWGRYMPPEAVEKLLALLPRDPAPGMEVIWDGAAYAWEGQFADPTAWGVSPRFVEYFRATRKPVPDINAFIRAHETELEGINLRSQQPGDGACASGTRHPPETLPELYMTSSFGGLVETGQPGGGQGQRAALRGRGAGPGAGGRGRFRQRGQRCGHAPLGGPGRGGGQRLPSVPGRGGRHHRHQPGPGRGQIPPPDLRRPGLNKRAASQEYARRKQRRFRRAHFMCRCLRRSRRRAPGPRGSGGSAPGGRGAFPG